MPNRIYNKQVTPKGYKMGGRAKKMGGGMMGRRMGYQAGSKKGKVPTTPKEKTFGMLSVKKGLDNNKNIRDASSIVSDWDNENITVDKLNEVKKINPNTKRIVINIIVIINLSEILFIKYI